MRNRPLSNFPWALALILVITPGDAGAGADDEVAALFKSADGALAWQLPPGWTQRAGNERDIRAINAAKRVAAYCGYDLKSTRRVSIMDFAEHLRTRVVEQLKGGEGSEVTAALVADHKAAWFIAKGQSADGKLSALLLIVVEHEQAFVRLMFQTAPDIGPALRDELQSLARGVTFNAAAAVAAAKRGVVIKSRDGVLELRLPRGWAAKRQNDAAEAVATHAGKQLSVRAGYDRRSDFAGTFEDYSKRLLKQVTTQVKDAEVGAPREGEIDGQKTVVYVVKGSVDDWQMIYFVQVCEGKTHYLKMLAWGRASVVEENAEEIELALQGVREAQREGSAQTPGE